MRDLLLLGLLGIGIGGFYGILGTGIVVGHKGSGLINLDQGALAMYPAYAFVTMRNSGTVFFPWFDFIPGPIDVPVSLTLTDGGAGKGLALVVGLAMSVLLGIMMQALVFGPLRRKPPVSKVIGSLGALLYLQSVAVHHFGAKAQFVDGILPEGGIDNPLGLGGRLPYDRIAFALIALLIGAALSIYYRTTRMGIATRAVEDSEFGASLLGYSPNRIAMINWLLSTTTTGLAGILALDIVSLTPSRYTLLVVPALGAALFGNLTSPWLAAIGGVMLGMFQSFSAGLTLESWWPSWLPAEGVRQAVPLIVIVAFQYRRGHLLPVRSIQM
jgi:branched-chain amino acid transport system permease protein